MIPDCQLLLRIIMLDLSECSRPLVSKLSMQHLLVLGFIHPWIMQPLEWPTSFG